MDRLTIHAVTPESGRAILAALSGFRTELFHTGDGCEVTVTLAGDEEIAAVLSALEQHIATRGDGPAQVDMFGRSYLMHGG